MTPFVPLLAGLVVATVSLWRVVIGNSRDFDDELKTAHSFDQRRRILAAAREAHPVDYYYPLVLSTLEPTGPDLQGHSPRLRALNQALKLCTNCPDIHLQVARTMWSLGRRSQAIAEWCTAVRGQRTAFLDSLGEFSKLGARPSELARLAESDPGRLLEVARFLVSGSRPEQAESIIAAASAAGAPQLEILILQAQMKLSTIDNKGAQDAIARAKSVAPNDSRVVLLEAQGLLMAGGKEAAPQALAVVEKALDRTPNDLELQRKRIEIVSRFERWSAADRAILGLKQALMEAVGSTVEANVAAAGIYLSLGRVREAIIEYRIATTADPGNASVWRKFAETAEVTRHYDLAREAYSHVMRLAPDTQVLSALRRLDDLQNEERLRANDMGGPGLGFDEPGHGL